MVMSKADIYECDVLVIGGGLAGAWAAIRTKDFVDDVILVDKADCLFRQAIGDVFTIRAVLDVRYIPW